MDNSGLTKTAQDQSLLIPSAAYNGTQITKIDLINYLFDVVDLKKELDAMRERVDQRSAQIDTLYAEKKKKYIRKPAEMSRPTGLAALSSRKKREYENWLRAAPERERAYQQLLNEENQRIEQVQTQIDALWLENCDEIVKMKAVSNQYCQLLQKHIIPPDYRGGDIPAILLGYLFNSRAHTLMDAINLYHQEQHQSSMLQIAQEQKKQAERAFAEQKDMAWQQLQMQYQQMQLQKQQLEQLEEIAEDAAATRRAAESAKFYAEMEYLSNL